jgi:arylsulfatase
MGGRAWSATFDVSVPEGGCEGVLFARGSHNVGATFFIKDGKLQFDYNALGRHARAAFDLELSPGDHQLEARFLKEGLTGSITLAVDGADIGAIEIPQIVRMMGSTGTDIGCDRLSTVVDDYEGPFAFTGKIHKATFRRNSKRDEAEIEVTARAEMAKE